MTLNLFLDQYVDPWVYCQLADRIQKGLGDSVGSCKNKINAFFSFIQSSLNC